MKIDTPRLDRRVASLERLARRILSAVLFAALLIAGALLRPDDPVLGTVLLVTSVLPLLHALFSGLLDRPARPGAPRR
ncbi:MAG: transporter [Microbacterium sp.]|nr:transporter [Microbacterium sp.]